MIYFVSPKRFSSDFKIVKISPKNMPYAVSEPSIINCFLFIWLLDEYFKLCDTS